MHRTTVLTSALLFVATIALGACGGKPAPKSTTTTSTQIKTETDDGNATSIDTKEVKTEQVDGSSTTQKTQTTNTSAPSTP